MSGPEADYLKAKQAVQLLKAERDTLSRTCAEHPKIIKLNDEIAKQENLIKLYRADTVEKLETRRKSIGKQMENLETNIKEWEAKALDLESTARGFNRIKGKDDRLKTHHDRLTSNLKEVGVSQTSIPAIRSRSWKWWRIDLGAPRTAEGSPHRSGLRSARGCRDSVPPRPD